MKPQDPYLKFTLSKSVQRRLAIQRGEPAPDFGDRVPPARPAQPKRTTDLQDPATRRRVLMCVVCGRHRRMRVEPIALMVICCSCGTRWAEGIMRSPISAEDKKGWIDLGRAVWPSRKRPASV